MVNATKAWKFAGGYAYINTNGKRGWSKTKPDIVGGKVNKSPSTKRKANRKVYDVTTKRRRRSSTKKRARPKKDKRMPILTLAGIGAAVSKPIQNAIEGDYEGALAELGARFTGYNYQSKTFDWKYAAMNGYIPIIAGAIGSKIATKVGANRAIAKIPMIGKYIKL